MIARPLAGMLAVAAALVVAPLAVGQTVVAPHAHRSARALPAHVVIPQSRSFNVAERGQTVQITEVTVGVVITEQVATTTMDIALKNPTNRRLEAEIVMPVPDDAVVRSFDFQGAGSEPSAELLRREEARRIYDSIVAKTRDPALLEFVGYNLIRSSVFPVEPNGDQKVRLTYEQVLPADGARVDYVLPRSESLDYRVPWNVTVRVKAKQPIATVYSPSHKLQTVPGPNDNIRSVRIAQDARLTPGAFRLSYLVQRDSVTASLMAYPDPSINGGYFLLLAGLPEKGKAEQPAIRREVTLVLDRSGSMNGEKLEQVREAALQIIAGLDDGEAFNIILYNEAVESFAARPVVKDERTTEAARAYLKSIKARGGTNIHDALLEALRPKPTEGALPMVLFLTDGRPTIGQTAESAIRALVTKANTHKRRVFTFGVGVDVNSPLLENLAYASRATTTFVLPGEDIEVKVAGVFKRLSGPVLADPMLRLVDADGHDARHRVHDLIPIRLPDLFKGDQLVVLGQYVGEKPLAFRLKGNHLGKDRTFRFEFDLDGATTRNAFVPRLWAGRKIGLMIDAIRSSGADHHFTDPAELAKDPKIKELVDEIVRLSTEFGILTEYTAFLAREGTDLSRRDAVMAEAFYNFNERAVNGRSGLASINQDNNAIYQKAQSTLNPRNGYWNAEMQRVDHATVQQVADRALYRKNNRWVDSRIVERSQELRPTKVLEFGSKPFMDLCYKLAEEGRQGTLAVHGELILLVDGEPVLIKCPTTTN